MNKPGQDESDSRYRYDLMRPQQIIARRDQSPIAYVPLGPLEWHGPALPYGMDFLHAYRMSLALAREFGGVVLPPLPLGSETVLESDRVKDRGFKGDEKIWGMDFPTLPLPSLYVRDHAMGTLLHDLVGALKRQLFRLIVMVNGHGAKYHVVTLERIAAEETEPGKVAVIHGFAFDVGPGKGGHAERYETGFLMAYYPDTVDLSTLPSLPTPLKNVETGILDGPTCVGKPTADFTVRPEQDPRHASAEEGFQDVVNGVRRIGAQMKKAMESFTYQPGLNTYYSQ